jgi:putative ABC transport system permease protein
MAVFGGLALILAAVGIYGVLASTVEQRTQELGIRMALGAREADVLRLVISGGLKLVLAGMALGLAVGFALTRWLSTLLFGVNPTSPMVYLTVAAGMISVALVACYLPARSAVKVDPMLALRSE